MEPFAAGYLNSKAGYTGKKIAEGVYEAARSASLGIGSGDMFAGLCDKKIAVTYGFGSGVTINKYIRLDGTEAELIERMKPHETTRIVEKAKTDAERAAFRAFACWGGVWGGHANPDFGLILGLGTDGLRGRAEKYRKINAGNDEFYDGVIISLNALDKYAERLSALAAEKAENSAGEARKKYARVAEALKTVPKRPAYDFFSACQSFWLAFTFEGIDSPGRFDQYMYPYYVLSGEADRRECLEAMWRLFHETRAWNLCVSGSDECGRDVSNELTYDILDTALKYKFHTPNITMRAHPGTPEKLLNKAADVLASGIGMPALYNDETVCGALAKLGIPERDARLYCMNGCNQIDIMGKSHMGLEDGEVSLIKCLELALFDGVCQTTGARIGPNTGDARDFAAYGDFFGAYKKQVEYITDLCVDMANRSQRIYAERAPNPYRSALIEGCLEKGLDYKNGGPLYNHGQILAEGVADTADSLAVIYHFVYGEKLITMAGLIDALERDFEGYDELLYKVEKFVKFGNDDARADIFAKEIIDHFFKYLNTKRTYRGRNDTNGGIYGGGCSTFSRAPDYGRAVGAMPSGKRKGSPLIADSVAATPGRDVNGPTALINSVLNYDQSLAASGFVFNIKFDKKLFGTEKGKKSFIHLMRTYFKNGGQQMSVNVLSSDELRAAKAKPEEYKNLIVRVGGYSELFANLPGDLQDSVISRTEHALP